MMLAYYGICCAHDCTSPGVGRAQIGVGHAPPMLVPLCQEHLDIIIAEVADLRGHDLAVLTPEDGPQK